MFCALNARLRKPGSAISAEKLTNLSSGLRAQLNKMPKQFLRSQAVRLGLDNLGPQDGPGGAGDQLKQVLALLTALGLCAQLNEMPKQFLRGQAVRLGLDDSGLKTDLVSELVAHLTDQIGPDGLMALGPGAEPEARDEARPKVPSAGACASAGVTLHMSRPRASARPPCMSFLPETCNLPPRSSCLYSWHTAPTFSLRPSACFPNIQSQKA